MDFLHYVRTLRRRWRLVVVFLALGTVAGWASAAFATEQRVEPVYVATHMLQVERNNPNLQQLAILATSGEIPNRVADRLGGSGTLLATQVKARPIITAGLLQIIAVGQDPERVVLLADTFAEELVRYESEAPPSPESQQKIAELETRNVELARMWGDSLACIENPPSAAQLERCKADYEKSLAEKKANDEEIERLKNPQNREPSLVTVNTAEAIPVTPATAEKILADGGSGGNAKNAPSNNANTPVIVTPARDLTSRPDPLTRSGAGAALGLMLGVGLALTIDRIDPRIRTKLDAEEAFGWPVIAEIPVFTKRQRTDDQVVAYTFPRSRAAESFRALRTALLFSDIGRTTPTVNKFAESSTEPATATVGDNGEPKAPAKVILVTSPGPAEGKTTTVANLAAVFAEADYKVFVLNCDFRRPQMHRYLGSPDVTGEIVDTAVPGVALVNHVFDDEPHANPAEVLAAQRFFIQRARADYDVILLDTAPLLATNDAADILPEADQVVLVGRVGRTTKEAADRAAELLDRHKAPTVGVVLTAASERAGGRYYYYEAKSYYLDEYATYTDERPRKDKGAYTDERPRKDKGAYTDERPMRSPLATLADPQGVHDDDSELEAAARALGAETSGAQAIEEAQSTNGSGEGSPSAESAREQKS
ncbi:MAG: hypothetical protein N2037_05705 [Acidimicrobiales bacterium]|nr:hypothetical protein [Acidimicrobiales bacterium]